MTRLAAMTVAAFVLAPLVAAHPIPQRPPHAEAGAAVMDSFRGTVFSVTQDQLTLWSRGTTRKFKVGTDTLVLVNGTGGVLRDVRPGYVAEVTAVSEGDDTKARFIDAFIPR